MLTLFLLHDRVHSMCSTKKYQDYVKFTRLERRLLTYTATFEPLWTLNSEGAESDTHASFESGFRNNSIVQNNNYSFFFFYNYQNTPSFLAPLYTFVCVCFACVLVFFYSFIWTSTIVVVFIQHLEDSERRSAFPSRWPRPLSLSYLWLPPSPLPRVRMSFNFASSLG